MFQVYHAHFSLAQRFALTGQPTFTSAEFLLILCARNAREILIEKCKPKASAILCKLFKIHKIL